MASCCTLWNVLHPLPNFFLTAGFHDTRFIINNGDTYASANDDQCVCGFQKLDPLSLLSTVYRKQH